MATFVGSEKIMNRLQENW